MAIHIVSGGNRHLLSAQSADFVIPGDFSWGMWYQFLTGLEDSDFLITIGEDSEDEADNYIIWCRVEGSSGSWDIRYIHEYSTGSNEDVTWNTNLADDVWFHLAIVRDNTANTVILYLDGAAFATFNYTNDCTNTGTGVTVRIGNQANEDDSAKLDAVYMADHVIANVALSVDEVKMMMAHPERTRGLVQFCRFDDNALAQPDYAGNNHTLTADDTLAQVDHPHSGPPFGFDQEATLVAAGAAPAIGVDEMRASMFPPSQPLQIPTGVVSY